MELLYKILCATEPLRPEPDEPVYVFDGIGKILVGWVLFAGTLGLLARLRGIHNSREEHDRSLIDPHDGDQMDVLHHSRKLGLHHVPLLPQDCQGRP